MLLSTLKEVIRRFPRKPAPADWRLISRYLGIGVWAGVFLSLTLLAILYSRFSAVPDLPHRLTMSVVGLSFAEALLGYLLYTGYLIRD